jgi:hypothetical protein
MSNTDQCPSCGGDCGTSGCEDAGIESAGAVPESPCDFQCGYFSTGQDLWNHVFHEHARCSECGNWPSGEYAVSHKPDCPRLHPGYVYPPPGDLDA